MSYMDALNRARKRTRAATVLPTCAHKDHVVLIARVSFESPTQWIWCRDCGVLITGEGEVFTPREALEKQS